MSWFFHHSYLEKCQIQSWYISSSIIKRIMYFLVSALFFKKYSVIWLLPFQDMSFILRVSYVCFSQKFCFSVSCIDMVLHFWGCSDFTFKVLFFSKAYMEQPQKYTIHFILVNYLFLFCLQFFNPLIFFLLFKNLSKNPNFTFQKFSYIYCRLSHTLRLLVPIV